MEEEEEEHHHLDGDAACRSASMAHSRLRLRQRDDEHRAFGPPLIPVVVMVVVATSVAEER